MKKEIKKLQNESDKHYKVLKNFVNDYCKSEEDKKEFFEALNSYLETEIELENWCGQ
jgi:hypothetical protein